MNNMTHRTIARAITQASISLLALIWLACSHAQTEPQQAINFTLKSHTNKNIKLSEFRGQVILLGFWSSRCGKCIQQLDILNKYSTTYKLQNFTSLAVNIDNMSSAFHIANKNNLQFPVLFDDRDVSRLYKINETPEYYLIDRDGKVRHILNAEQLAQHTQTQSLIRDLLNE